jgi:hypothetical protein
MVTWPLTLPQKPLEMAYEETMRAGQNRSSIEGLPLIQHQRSSAQPKPIKLMFQMTNGQYDIFQAFYRSDLGFGALPFQWTHPRTNVICRIQFIGGQPPRGSAAGYDTYRIECDAEILP